MATTEQYFVYNFRFCESDEISAISTVYFTHHRHWYDRTLLSRECKPAYRKIFCCVWPGAFFLLHPSFAFDPCFGCCCILIHFRQQLERHGFYTLEKWQFT